MRPKVLVSVLAAVVLSLGLGLWLGGHPERLPGFVRDAFVDDSVAQVADAQERIQDRYYREVGDQALTDAAIKGMVESLGDRFSAYFTPKEYAEFQSSQRQAFSGVGLSVSGTKDGLLVLQVYDESPASRAGLRRDDVITAVDGKPIRGLEQALATARIKGPPGSDVTLTWRTAKGAERTEKLTRAIVEAPYVASEMKTVDGRKVGVVALSQFGPGAHAQVYEALRKLEDRGAQAFVFDLRRNGGGLVSEAQLIASAFLEKGPIVTTRGRSVESVTLNATGDPVVPDKPLVVLVDRGTASASEIVAGALQDDDRATVVGTRTFGKGVFQQLIELPDGGALDLTAGQYFTPKGRNLGGQGVKTGTGLAPDVRAEDDPETRADEALQRALEVVSGKL